MERHLPNLSDIITKQLLFLNRADVQNQILTIFFCLVISGLLSKWFWRWLQKRLPAWTQFSWEDQRFSPLQYFAILIQRLSFPLISLILLNCAQLLFYSQDWTRGLLRVAIQLIGVYSVYCFLLAILYGTFSIKTVKEYHYRLFAPIFVLFVFKTIINLYNNLEEIAQSSPFKLFNSPITLSAIFWLIAGLYFWIVIVILVESLILTIIQAKTPSEAGAIQATALLIRYFLIALGVVLILGYVGVNGTALAAITGGLSVGIGFGLQQVVSNFVSGILLLFEKVLKPGDIISLDGQNCEVKQLGIRATTVRMLADNSEKIIPNQTFFTEDVTTYTGSNNLVNCSIVVGVGYDSHAKQVMNLLLEIAHRHSKVLKYPPPLAFFLNFGDSSLNFELKFWLENINMRKRVISELNCLILERFAEEKIEIPFPQQDIHIRSG